MNNNCIHQYWDMGRCIKCFKTAYEIDEERKIKIYAEAERLAGDPDITVGVCPLCAAGDGPHTLEHEGKP